MELPVFIDRLPDQSGFTAHIAAPFQLSATAATAADAHRELVALLHRRLQEGMELRTINLPAFASGGLDGGWLPDDELTRDWRENVQNYRAECDAADRQRLESSADQTEASH